MENKIVFNQKDLILKVNKNYDKSKFRQVGSIFRCLMWR